MAEAELVTTPGSEPHGMTDPGALYEPMSDLDPLDQLRRLRDIVRHPESRDEQLSWAISWLPDALRFLEEQEFFTSAQTKKTLSIRVVYPVSSRPSESQ